MSTTPEFCDLVEVTPANPRAGEGSMIELN